MSTRFALIVVWTSLLVSCNSGNKKRSDAAACGNDFKTFDTILPMAGSWISEEYAKKLDSTKSPMAVQSFGYFISMPSRTLQQIQMIVDFHQGGADAIILKHNGNYEIWRYWDDTVRNCLDSIQIISPSKIKTDGQIFIKINPAFKNERPLILEEMLFKGRYKSATGETVEFKNTGEVTGLGTYHYYMPYIDYYDEAMNIDQLGIGQTDTTYESFGFKFKRDTLQLYKLKCLTYDSANKTCGVVDFGDLAYTLIKAK
jgi:hypothetical protein